MAGGLLSLDIATKTGWAYAPSEIIARWPRAAFEWTEGAPADAVLSGSVDHKAMTSGRVVFTYRRWLLDMLTMHRPTLVVFEAPLANNHSGQRAAQRILYLCGATEDACYQRSVACLQEHLSTIRKHFLGAQNKRMGRDAMKQVVIDECRRRGFAPTDDNAADALAVLDYAADQFRHRFTTGSAAA